MKRCDTCNATYSDDFKFCPADATALRLASECEAQREIPASASSTTASKVRSRKWLYPVLAVSVAAVAFSIFMSLKSAQSSDRENTQPSVIDDQTQTTKKAPAKQRPVRRPAQGESNRKTEEPRGGADVLVEQARVQQLVATGYRQMQQRDYAGARDAFEAALEIDPQSVAAQKGLKAAQMAESVEGVAGVFRR